MPRSAKRAKPSHVCSQCKGSPAEIKARRLKPMLQCSRCQGWLHPECEGFSIEDFVNDPDRDYICGVCNEFSSKRSVIDDTSADDTAVSLTRDTAGERVREESACSSSTETVDSGFGSLEVSNDICAVVERNEDVVTELPEYCGIDPEIPQSPVKPESVDSDPLPPTVKMQPVNPKSKADLLADLDVSDSEDDDENPAPSTTVRQEVIHEDAEEEYPVLKSLLRNPERDVSESDASSSSFGPDRSSVSSDTSPVVPSNSNRIPSLRSVSSSSPPGEREKTGCASLPSRANPKEGETGSARYDTCSLGDLMGNAIQQVLEPSSGSRPLKGGRLDQMMGRSQHTRAPIARKRPTAVVEDSRTKTHEPLSLSALEDTKKDIFSEAEIQKIEKESEVLDWCDDCTSGMSLDMDELREHLRDPLLQTEVLTYMNLTTGYPHDSIE